MTEPIIPLAPHFHNYLISACMEGEAWADVARAINPSGTNVTPKFVESYFNERAMQHEKEARNTALQQHETILEMYVMGETIERISMHINKERLCPFVQRVIDQSTKEERDAAIMRVKQQRKWKKR